jgi:hypothetical protein
VDILSNDKFGLLCTLLYTNFGDGKGHSGFYFDFSQINTCMKEGKYEGSAELFHQDIQKVSFSFMNMFCFSKVLFLQITGMIADTYKC